jgi:hypothetical protein
MADDVNDKLSIWTVYDHPTDYPSEFIARRFEVDVAGSRPTDDVLGSTSLDLLRNELAARGLTVINRMPADDKKIVEVWL